MNNLECAVAVLAAHRAGGMWTDEAVAADMMAQLNIDPTGEAKNAKPDPALSLMEADVLGAEANAKEAMARAHAMRVDFEAQTAAMAEVSAAQQAAVDAGFKAKAAADAARAPQTQTPVVAAVAPLVAAPPVAPVDASVVPADASVVGP